jgi:hypothetical protein
MNRGHVGHHPLRRGQPRERRNHLDALRVWPGFFWASLWQNLNWHGDRTGSFVLFALAVGITALLVVLQRAVSWLIRSKR